MTSHDHAKYGPTVHKDCRCDVCVGYFQKLAKLAGSFVEPASDVAAVEAATAKAQAEPGEASVLDGSGADTGKESTSPPRYQLSSELLAAMPKAPVVPVVVPTMEVLTVVVRPGAGVESRAQAEPVLHIYTVNYGHGLATMWTTSTEAVNRFYHLASQCFGIRKSIALVEIRDAQPGEMPKWAPAGSVEALRHSGGDRIAWDAKGEKTLSEWD